MYYKEQIMKRGVMCLIQKTQMDLKYIVGSGDNQRCNKEAKIIPKLR